MNKLKSIESDPIGFYDEETNLHYNWNRYYDPELGRYITSDPIGLDGGINTYLYANANSVKYFDYQGLNPMDIYNDIHSMRSDGHQKYPDEENSSMRHCVISCMVAKKHGMATSMLAGTTNEYQGFYMHDLPNIKGRFNGDPWAFQPKDFTDNFRGYKCSQEESEQCGKQNESDEDTCVRCCSLY